MNFNNYYGFDEAFANAEQNRLAGARQMSRIKDIKDQWALHFEQAQIGMNMPKEQALVKYLRSKPEQIEILQDYIKSRGYVPQEDIIGLSMQVARARAEEINNCLDCYDVNNYDPDMYYSRFSGARAHSDQILVPGTLMSNGLPPTASQAAQIAGHLAANAAPVTAPVYNIPVPTPDYSRPPSMEITNPDAETAEAEVIGSEMQGESFPGEYDAYLPVLEAARMLGEETLSRYDGSSDNFDIAQVEDIFKETGLQDTKYGNMAASILDAANKTQAAIRDAKSKKSGGGGKSIKDIVRETKENLVTNEKNKAINEYKPVIIFGLAIIAIAFMLKK
jgi:hypothetical protein